jgi:hypothetical protein
VSDTAVIFAIFAKDYATGVLGKLGGTWSKLALGVAAAAGTMAAKTTMMAANFQSQTLRLVTSAGETHANLALVSNGILNLAGQVGDTTTELNAAMYTIESGGRHGAEGLQVLQAAAEGAKAEQSDLATVADAVTSVLQDYGLKGKDAAGVTSQLVAAVGAGKTNFNELAGSLSAVLPIASAAGIKLADVTGALASMTVHGMSAEQASQNLADTIRHMQKPTMVQVKAMGQLGISASDVTDKLGDRGITGTLQYLSQTILSKMGPSGKVLLGTFMQSQQAAADLKQMMAGMTPSMRALAQQFADGKITVADYNTTIKALPAAQNTQMRQFATLQKRVLGFSDALRSGSPAAVSYTAALASVTGDAAGLNTALMLTGDNTKYVNDAVRTVAAATADAGNHVRGWSDIQQTFNQRLAQAKGTVEALGIRIGTALLPYMQKALGATMSAVGWFTKHKTVARDLAVAIGVLAGALLLYKTYTVAAAVATKVATVAKLAWKGVLLAARGALIAYNFAQALTNSTLWTWIGVQALDFAAWVRKAATVVANTAALVAYKVAQFAVTAATKAWAAAQWLINVAMAATPIGLIITAIGLLVVAIVYLWNHSKGFRDFWISVWNWIKNAALDVAHWFAGPFTSFWVGIWQAVWGFLKGVGHWFAHDFVNFFTRAGTDIKNWALDVWHWITDKWNKIVKFVEGLGGRLAAVGSHMWDWLQTGLKGAVNGVVTGLNWVIDAVNNVTHGLSDAWSWAGIPSIPSIPHVPHLVSGGDLTSAGVIRVGERGPETLIAPAGTRVLPHGMSAGGGQPQRMVAELRAAPGDQVAEMLLSLLRSVVVSRYNGDSQLAFGGRSY